MSTIFAPLPSAAAVRPASADPADVRLATCGADAAWSILVMGGLEVGAVVLIMTELAAVATIYFAEVPPRRLHGNATSRDIS